MLRSLILATLGLGAGLAAQSPIPLPTFTSTFTAALTRGFYFQAPVDCLITGLEVPNAAAQPNQVVEVMDFGPTAPPAFPTTTTGTQLFYDNATPAGVRVVTNITLTAGNYYGILGACNDSLGSITSYNSYGAGPFTSSILGTPTTLARLITQFGIAATGGNNPTARSSGPIGRVLVDIVPAVGVFPDFTSDVTTGTSPLTVNFTDTTYSNPNPITSWAWDFDNDGTIDSTLQNPSHTYTTCGTYDVALTVDDGTGPATKVETAYISTDQVTARFTDSLIAPLMVQFADTSLGNPTAWLWDLDGDGTTDSTARNPTFTYPTANPVDVSLTASRLCGPPDTFTKRVVPAQQLTTTFADDNSGSAGWTVYFDLDVQNSGGLAIAGFDVNSTTVASTPFTLEVYLTNGTYAGNEQSAADWVLIGTAAGTTAGRGLPSPATFPAPVYVAPGDYGIAIHYLGAAIAYTDGNGANQMFNNGDLLLDLGISRATVANAPFGAGTTNSPRVWNGTIFYETCAFTGNSGYGYAGTGCAGSNGLATLTAQSNPVLGTTLNVDVDNLPVNAAVMMTGLSNTTSALGPLPLDGTQFGAPGCWLRVSPDVNLLLLGAGGTATWSLPIPNDPALACVRFFQQPVVLDPGFNPAGAVLGNAAGFVLGN